MRKDIDIHSLSMRSDYTRGTILYNESFVIDWQTL